jgi:hypothetical protein
MPEEAIQREGAPAHRSQTDFAALPVEPARAQAVAVQASPEAPAAAPALSPALLADAVCASNRDFPADLQR